MTNAGYMNKKGPSIQELDAQIADLQNRGRVSAAGDNRIDIQRLLEQRNQMVGQQAGQGGPGNPWDNIDTARKTGFGLATDRLHDLQGDPIDKLVMDELKKRVSGDIGPYDAATKNALMTQQAEMAAQIESNQLGQLQSHGGSVTDPSYQAQLREIQGARQAAAQKAALDIGTKANLANYDAKTGAVAGLGAFNVQRNAGITGQSNYLTDQYSKLFEHRETPPAQPQSSGVPDFNAWLQWFQGQQRGQQGGAPAPAPVQQAAAPAPAPQPTQPARTSGAVTNSTPYPARTSGTAQQATLFPSNTQWSGVPYPSNSYTQQPNYNLGGQIVQNAVSGTPFSPYNMGTNYTATQQSVYTPTLKLQNNAAFTPMNLTVR